MPISDGAARPHTPDTAFDDFKRALGPSATNYTNAELEEMLSIFDRMSDVLFDAWLIKRNKG